MTETSLTKAGLIASQLSCAVYQEMIDRGWRRSGTYLYAPDLERSCCPQYTIKLDALAFKPSRSQRKLLNRWNRFVLLGNGADGKADGKTRGPDVQQSSKPPEFCLESSIHQSEKAFASGTGRACHAFEVTLERSTYTDEKYTLFEAYQARIHHDFDNQPSSFTRFLVQTPLIREAIPYSTKPPEHLPTHFGSHHQMYRLDGELIAMGVIDILPGCVSSVYFMYNPKWEKYSLGKLSALREASLVQEMQNAGLSSMNALYLGFYIHNCQKMRYKGEYSPSYLADPEEHTWHPLEFCTHLLDKHRYATFAHPERSLKGPIEAEMAGESEEDVEKLMDGVNSIYSIRGNSVSLIPVLVSKHWRIESIRRDIVDCVRALGKELAREIIFTYA